MYLPLVQEAEQQEVVIREVEVAKPEEELLAAS